MLDFRVFCLRDWKLGNGPIKADKGLDVCRLSHRLSGWKPKFESRCMGECSVKSTSASHDMTREVVRIGGNEPDARPVRFESLAN